MAFRVTDARAYPRHLLRCTRSGYGVTSGHMSKQPTVTFALFAYNQEKYIREAVEAALSQTYSPLEIMLSDDCSSDRTFEIMQEMAKEYRGPHTVVLNRNQKNLGIGNHVNYIFEKTRSDFIVMAAGDDISLPERTAVLMEAMVLTLGAMGGGSASIVIDKKGCEIARNTVQHGARCLEDDDDFRIITGRQIPGATAIWSRKLYETFGPIYEGVNYEDIIFTIRALTLGKVFLLADRPLVKYRQAGITSKPSGLNVFINERQALSLFRNLNCAAESLERELQCANTETRRTQRIAWHLKIDRAALQVCSNWWRMSIAERKTYCSSEGYRDLPPYHQNWLQARLSRQWIFYCRMALREVSRSLKAQFNKVHRLWFN